RPRRAADAPQRARRLLIAGDAGQGRGRPSGGPRRDGL
ncbi:MAG: hypothetical protein AVDCRST_MAG15-2525, partial [uncultured Rubellimicrobium sp.]